MHGMHLTRAASHHLCLHFESQSHAAPQQVRLIVMIMTAWIGALVARRPKICRCSTGPTCLVCHPLCHCLYHCLYWVARMGQHDPTKAETPCRHTYKGDCCLDVLPSTRSATASHEIANGNDQSRRSCSSPTRPYSYSYTVHGPQQDATHVSRYS